MSYVKRVVCREFVACMIRSNGYYRRISIFNDVEIKGCRIIKRVVPGCGVWFGIFNYHGEQVGHITVSKTRTAHNRKEVVNGNNNPAQA